MGPFRREYRELTNGEANHIQLIKLAAAELHTRILAAAMDGRAQSLAVTKLEESVMWAVKGITH